MSSQRSLERLRSTPFPRPIDAKGVERLFEFVSSSFPYGNQADIRTTTGPTFKKSDDGRISREEGNGTINVNVFARYPDCGKQPIPTACRLSDYPFSQGKYHEVHYLDRTGGKRERERMKRDIHERITGWFDRDEDLQGRS